MQGQLRIAVIGSQTCHPDSPLAYTVYRTAVTYRGLCYQRLIRYSKFMSFAKKLKLAPNAKRISAKLPPKMWSRKASLKPETVEQRQVLLNEYMQQVCARPLTPKSEERLLKLLQVGDFAPDEREDRVINSFSIKPQSSSEMEERNMSMQTAPVDETPSQPSAKVSCNSLTDEEEGAQNAKPLQNGEQNFHREDSEASTNPASEDFEARADRSLSERLAPPLQLTTRPTSNSLNSQNMKRVLFEAGESESLSLKEEGRDSTSSLTDYTSTTERHYSGQIKKCISSIEDIMESSRSLEVRIREKHMESHPRCA